MSWSSYGGDPGSTRYAPLTQIDRANVGELEVAWTYRTGELGEGFASRDMGGPIVTAGGLIFIAAATDDYLRAFDLDTGEELWKAALPAGGQATPMTYRLEATGKQYVVIAAGGHGGLGTTRGDHVVAFALPDDVR